MKYLITGINSGLGKFLYEELGGYGFNRKNSNELLKINGVDTIVHCAYDKKEIIFNNEILDYLDSSIFLTKKLLKIPHKKFVFLSTVNVYPQSLKIHKESENININNIPTIYGLTKLICEEMVKKTNSLIMRCPHILGKYSNNNITKLINGGKLSLSEKSELNFIGYDHILNFILKDKCGIYNMVASKNVKFGRLATVLNKKPKFGKHVYNVGKIDNFKFRLDKTSEDLFLEFMKMYQ